MARIHANLQLDPNRYPEQETFLRSRVTVLREVGGQFWVEMDEAQVETFLSEGFVVNPEEGIGILEVGALRYNPASDTPSVPESLRASPPSGEATAFWIVHFIAPIDKSWIRALAEINAEIVHELNHTAVVVRMNQAAADQAREMTEIDSVALFHPAYTVSPELAGQEELFDAVTFAQLAPQAPPSAAQGNLQVEFFDGLDPEDFRAALEAAGATIVNDIAQGFLVDIAPESIAEVLAVGGIFSAAPPGEKRLFNHNAGVIIGTNQVRNFGTVDFLVNLTGQGEIGAVVDSGFDVGNLAGAALPPALGGAMTAFHPDLVAPMRVLRNSNTPGNAALTVPDGAPHGTHVAGTVAGTGVSSGGQARGMAPNALLIGLAPLPGNMATPFTFAAVNGARVINNSWGTTFVGAPTRNRYTPAQSRAADRWCFENPDVLICFAIGNDERDNNNNGTLDAIRMGLESTAKNVFTVGASENLRNDGGTRDSYRAFFNMLGHPPRWANAAFNGPAGGAAGTFSMSDVANDIAVFSDRGQVRTNGLANTRRVKPDIVAPGTNVLSLRSRWVAPPPALPVVPPPIPPAFWNPNFDSMLPGGINRNLHQIFHGTSMATPMVTGSALLVREYYHTRFGQMRRPLMLEGVAHPAAPPLPVFVDNPTISRHAEGLVCAWVTPALAAGQKNIVAVRLSRNLQPVDGTPIHLQDNVGDHPAPRIVTIGDNTYLLHRHGDNQMRLSCYDRALQPVAGFGTNGVVTLAPNTRADDDVPPDLIAVNNQLACVFPTDPNGYFFQRFEADDGDEVDNAAISFLFHQNTGSHRSLVWDGTHFTVVGVAHPGNYQLQVRQMTSAPALRPGPITILDQAAVIREPCLIRTRLGVFFALVWIDERNEAGGEIWFQLLTSDGNTLFNAHRVIGVPGGGGNMRRPHLVLQPNHGYALFWEDDRQGGSFDQYVTFLSFFGNVDERISRDPVADNRVLRISDTPSNVDGLGVFTDADGFVVAYQSPDEINSDRSAVYALAITASGAFQAQEDPSTPMLKSGNYVNVDLLDHSNGNLGALSAVWTGSHYYLLRQTPAAGPNDRLQWLRLNADGATDNTYGVNGIREVNTESVLTACETLWTGNDRLISVRNDATFGITVFLHDAQGAPVVGFGTAGAHALQDSVDIHTHTPPQLGFYTRPAFRAMIAYGSEQGGTLHLRQQILDINGNRVGTNRNLVTATGVAAHGWFQFVNGEGRSILVYHRVDGANTRVHCRRFRVTGTNPSVERNLSITPGEATNGVIARRPTAINSNNREYAAAWQFRANNAAPWEIHFSRLNRSGQPVAIPGGVAPTAGAAASDLTVINAATAGWAADRQAIEPQLACSYTHEPTAAPGGPAWSPSFGLAWIGEETDNTRRLYFIVLDENGRFLTMPGALPAAGGGALNPRTPIGITQISDDTADVQDFKLVWNGKVFFLTWTEMTGGRMHHRCTSLNRHGNRNAYALPSAALLRATLVNGATNISGLSLPNAGSGYGWGRVNLRQSLAAAPPVTMHARDDCAIGPGRTINYHFTLPPGTALLRVTLNWTDPPGPILLNRLRLTVHAPAAAGPGLRPEYRGNVWDTAAGQTHLSRAIPEPPTGADNHENIQTFKQVVLQNPPAGIYRVEVSVQAFPNNPFNQQDLQPFALVFLGSGPEATFNQTVAQVTAAPVY